MKAFLTASLVLLTPALALAQTAATPDTTTAKPAVKPAAKHVVKHPVRHVVKKKPEVSTSRQNLKSAAVNAAAGISAAEAALTPAELAIAPRVTVGTMPCELGNTVVLTADPQSPGYFNLEMKSLRYRMSPVTTTTGAIRLEDKKAGAVWLQLANKSMLLNEKLGQRLADECDSPGQIAVARSMKDHPGPTVLDAPVKAGAAPDAAK